MNRSRGGVIALDIDAPQVRIEIDEHTIDAVEVPGVPPARARGWLAALVGVAVLSIVAAALLTSTPESPESTTPVEEPSRALTAALAAEVDSFDRVTYTTTAPPLDTIVRGEDGWYTVERGVLLGSTDLLSWVGVRELRDYRTLAVGIDRGGDPVMLAERDGVLALRLVESTNDDLATFPIDGTLVSGAVNDGLWAAVVANGSTHTLLTGWTKFVSEPVGLGSRPPDSIGVVWPRVLLTYDEVRTNSTATANGDGSAGLTNLYVTGDPANLSDPVGWCVSTQQRGSLVSTGDGLVHFTEQARSWLVGSAAQSLVLAADGSLLENAQRRLVGPASIRPIATGRGWSIVAHALDSGGSDQRSVWTTTDGRQFERLEVPESRGSVGHVVWAYIGASEGVGVRVSDFGSSTGLLRVGDMRTRHPRPQELARVERVARPTLVQELRQVQNCGVLGPSEG